ncbi:hypothetical protein [Pontibacter lucknowensis]|uniref:Uncharacterized protein n=1 Tax=Pontibacter lucknowensis TaxID=1077936 RepID=A0A1N6TGB0_9BACT|nr:hypothetical protein [Pontibacter lucknowensis]SIQ52294.1 hypothetical protein SAMN05421545_0310 [Pontibacter lucknowensis]
MRYTFANLSRKTRLMIMLSLLIATSFIVYTDYVPRIFASFTGGFLIGLLIGEMAIYLRRTGQPE